LDKNKIFMIVIIALLVVLIGFMAWFMIFGIPKIMSAQNGDPVVVYETPEPPKKLSAQDITTYSLASDITSNLLPGTDGKNHVIRLTMGIGVDKTAEDQADILAVLAANEIIIRDAVSEILASRTMEDLQGAEGKEALSQDILARVQEEFASNTIVSAYVDFVMQ